MSKELEEIVNMFITFIKDKNASIELYENAILLSKKYIIDNPSLEKELIYQISKSINKPEMIIRKCLIES